MKNIVLAIVSLFAFTSLFSQTSVDALRFSQQYRGGTAKSLSMGNSLGALGADMSTLSTNPAGMGLYRSSVFEITPIVNNAVVNSTYLGTQNKDDKLNVNLGNLGVVFAVPVTGSDVKYFQFGMGINQLNNYNQDIYINGDNKTNSFVNDLQNQAYGKAPGSLDIFSSDLAWQSFLFSDTSSNSNGNLWYHSFFENGGVDQERIIRSRGSMNEFTMSMSTSFQDKLYLGATVGYTFLNYNEVSLMTENDEMDTIPELKSAFYDYEINTTGGGMSFKAGFIYRPNSWMRIGGAYHSPTKLHLSEDYSARMFTTYDEGSAYKGYDTTYARSTPFAYTMKTPMRLIADAAFVIKKKVVVTAEYEYIDYSETTMDFGKYSASDVNEEINRKYTSTHNFRAGVEYNLNPIRLRGGIAYYGSPYASEINDGSLMRYSAGIGVRKDNYIVEFAYVYSQKSEDYYLYNAANVEPSVLDFTSHQIVATVGFKF